MKKKKTKIMLMLAGIVVLLTMMVDVIHQKGDHTSHLVIILYPTWHFSNTHWDKETWQRYHPGKERPWWMSAKQIVIKEVTDF